MVQANECECLKNLDGLRMRLEKGEIEGFAIVVDAKEGVWIWGHKPDYVHAAQQLLLRFLKQRSEG